MAVESNFSLTSRYIPVPLFLYLQEKTGLTGLPGSEVEFDLKTRVEECLKFLSLIHHCKGPIPVSREIDDVWHLLILETKEYLELCERLPSKGYIHHQSNVHRKHQNLPATDADDPSCWALSWLVSYYSNFGEFTESSIRHWPSAKELLSRIQIETSLESHDVKAQANLSARTMSPDGLVGALGDLNLLLRSLADTEDSEA